MLGASWHQNLNFVQQFWTLEEHKIDFEGKKMDFDRLKRAATFWLTVILSRIRKKTIYNTAFGFSIVQLQIMKKKMFYQNTKKICFSFRWIRPISSWFTPQNLLAQSKILKNEIFPKKVCLAPSKCKGAKNLYGSYPTEFAPGALKTIGLCPIVF
jgi:hypothetical protein